MARSQSSPLDLDYSREPDPDKLPRYADRRQLADLHTRYYGPLSHRTLEEWPLDWRLVNGRALAEVRLFLAEAQRRFDAAPVVRGGRWRSRPVGLAEATA